MSKINIIQQKIKELSGGKFQKLCDRYLFKKYNFSNICPLGSEDGTNKPTKGIPDTYVVTSDGKYILIMYGTVKDNSFVKLEKDIKSCLSYKKLKLERDKIEKIICVYASTNITPCQQEKLKSLTNGIPLEIIDLGTLSHDLLEKYQSISNDELNIPIDSNQVFSIGDFIAVCSKMSSSSSLDTKFLFREQEIQELMQSILNNYVSIVVGTPGIGKTKLVLETCRLLDDSKYKIFCVKSNGAALEADLNMYFESPNNYILFLDDINEIRDIEYIFSFFQTRKSDVNIKLIATVRDYAKEKVINTIQKYTTPGILKIEKFSNDQIKEIVKQNYNINNPKYIEQICKISQGNVRLAVMSAQIAVKDGYMAIIDANQLFKSYYLNILNSFSADKKIYCVLFTIGFLGATDYKLNEITKILLNYFHISNDIFNSICDYLYSLEIVDKYENEILKINDQNFKDFIVYYVLIEKKYISIETLLSITFPQHSTQLVNAINMVLNIFYSKETLSYIKDEVNKVWESSTKDEEYYFVKHFSMLNLDKTLFFIQNSINNLETILYNIEDYKINDKSNNKSVSCFEIGVLSNFKRTEYFTDAIELLIDIFRKQPKYIHDVYITLSETYNYDEFSYRDDYKNEYLLVEKIWQLSNQGNNKKETILLIEIIKSLLDIENNRTRNGLDSHSIIFQPICVFPTKGIYKLRKYIWDILYQLYEIDIYKPNVENFIHNYHISGSDNEYRTKFIQFDMSYFSELFMSKQKTISFSLAVILYKLATIYDYMSVEPNKNLLRYKENKEFMYLINILPTRHKRNSDWKADDKERKTALFSQIKNYKKEDFKKLFNAYKKYESLSFVLTDILYPGLMDVFYKSENNSEQYVFLINLYFEKQIKTVYHPNKIVRNLFDFIGTEETFLLISNCRTDEKDLWLQAFYTEYPETDIDEKMCSQLINFVNNTLKKENPRIISVYSLEKYQKYNKRIIKVISQMICKKMYANNYIVTDFLKTFCSEKDAKKILELFGDDIENLEEIYLIFLKLHGDYSCFLFIEILNKDLSFWDKFTQKIEEERFEGIGYTKIFEYIWTQENYSYFINIAIDNMILKQGYYFIEFTAEKIFPKTNESKNSILQKQQQYIQNYIKGNAYNLKKLKVMFDIIVYRFDDLKDVFLLELLKYNDDIETFKKISLEQSSYSWSGSLLPIIEERIKSLERIKSKLIGSKYIQHRNYLDILINKKKEEKSRQRIQEYLESI